MKHNAPWGKRQHAGSSFSRFANASGESFKWFFGLRLAGAQADPFGPHADDDNRRTQKMARMEAVLFVAEGAISTRRLAHLATLADTAEVRSLIDQLNHTYRRCGSAFCIERVATGYQLLTRPEFSPWLNKLHQRQTELKLSPPAMETLTIVAYRQPIIRANIEAVRGVQCAEMLKQLMDRSLVRIAGQEDTLGRPYLYETTRKFLELFGLRHLDDLPMADQLRKTKTADAAADSAPGETSGETGTASQIASHSSEPVDEIEPPSEDELSSRRDAA